MQIFTAFQTVLWYYICMTNKIDSAKKPQSNYDKMNPSELIDVIKKQETEILGLKQELGNILSMIRLNNSQKYGKSGDSVPYPEGLEQLSFFNEAEKYGRKEDPEPSFENATAKVPKKPKEQGKKDRDLSGLAVTVIEHVFHYAVIYTYLL